MSPLRYKKEKDNDKKGMYLINIFVKSDVPHRAKNRKLKRANTIVIIYNISS